MNAPIANITPPELQLIPAKPATAFSAPTDSLCSSMGGTTLYTYRSRIGSVERELFCISVDKRMRTYTTFSPDRSCIRCAIAAMNESMKTLLSKNITPNKLTGNTYESAKCKSGLQLSSLLDMNVVFVPTPVITPPKYGAFVGNDIGKQWDAFAKNYLPFSNPKDSSPDRIQREAIQNLGESANQTDVLDQINTAFTAHMSEIDQRNANRPVDQGTAAKNKTYQQLTKEMRQMNTYFQSFQNIFAHFNSETCESFYGKSTLDSAGKK